MTRTIRFLSAMALAVWASPGMASAQTAKDIAGAWTLVSVTYDQAGKKSEPFGSNPKGMQVFDPNGRFSIIIMRNDLPKFGGRNRVEATPDESQKVVHGSLGYFGTYSVNDADKSIALQIDGATYPNWTGAAQKRGYALSGDTLTITNPTPSGGAGTATVVWKRAGQRSM